MIVTRKVIIELEGNEVGIVEQSILFHIGVLKDRFPDVCREQIDVLQNLWEKITNKNYIPCN
jgi:hypothetical protein